MVCRLGRGCLGLGLVVGSLNGTSLAAFPGLRGTGFRRLLLGLAFFVASDPVGFLLPVGTEAGVRVGGIAVASGRAVLVEPGLGAIDGRKTVGGENVCMLVRAGAGSLAWLLILASVWATGGKGFLEAAAAMDRGRALVGGGLGVIGFLWVGRTVGRETLAGTGWEVGSTGFLVVGDNFMKEGAAAFWVGRGFLTGAIEGEGTEGLIGLFWGVLVAVLFCNGWTGIVEMAGEAGGTGRNTSLTDSLAGCRGVRAGSPTETCL